MIALFYKVILSKSFKTVNFTKINKYMYIYTCLFPTMLCKYIKGKEHVPQAKKKNHQLVNIGICTILSDNNQDISNIIVQRLR